MLNNYRFLVGKIKWWLLVKQVVVFDNKSNYEKEDRTLTTDNYSDENESGAAFFVRILRYLETPQYLRKALFPKHCNLRFVVSERPIYHWILFVSCVYCYSFVGCSTNVVCTPVLLFSKGMLPPLDAPHHLRKHEWAPFREGKLSARISIWYFFSLIFVFKLCLISCYYYYYLKKH
jgi:hypothetical protein